MKICPIGTIVDTGEVLQKQDHRRGSSVTIRATAKIIATSEKIDIAVKGISGHRIANEIAASWVAKKLRLPFVAQTLLVNDPESKLTTSLGGELEGGINGRWLATRFSSLPKFENSEGIEELKALTNTPTFHQIIVFDALIANTDRQNQNLLRSSTEIFVFDHDKAFTGEVWTPAALRKCLAVAPSGGLFEGNIAHADNTALQAIAAVAAKWVGAITTTDAAELDELEQHGIIGRTEVDALKDFIVYRSANLQTLVQDVLNRNA